MRPKVFPSIASFFFVLLLASLACATAQPAASSTNAPQPTVTKTITPTKTARPSATPRPTLTPNLAATQRVEELSAEVQAFYEKGYLATTDGRFTELDDFSADRAQLGSYAWLVFEDAASDFFMSAHFKWDSASKNSDISGCGFVFGVQPNDDHYAVFLDRTNIEFRIRNLSLGYSTRVKPTRVVGKVKFDYPAEADFTLIVKGARAYVLVNGEVVNEYTLLQGRPLSGHVGLAVLSGTNKDYGTHCEMTNLHLWVPNK
jgi:hypothetical protein